jgi:hypothetical protein
VRVPALVIFILCLAASPLQARPQTAPGAQNHKTIPNAAKAPAKSKALLAAEKRIAELEAEVADRDNKLAAAETELEPLRKTMADIAAAAIPVSKIAPSDTVGRNRAILFVDPSGALLWYAKGADGKYFLAALNDQSEPTTLKDVLAKGFWRSVTIGDLTDENQALGKKAQENYNVLVDKYNGALALLKQSNELASQEQDFIQQTRAYTAANQAAERQTRINNALLMYSLMQHQTYSPPQILYNVPAWQPKPTINCTSTALVPGTVGTTCR